MPELPEVQTIVEYLNIHCLSKKIAVFENFKRLDPSLNGFDASCVGLTIKKATRRGKISFLHLSDGRVLMLHLRLSGSVLFTLPEDEAPKYVVYRIGFEDASSLNLIDPRKLLALKLYPSLEAIEEDLKGKVGTDALEMDLGELHEKIYKDPRPIKTVLMDQSIIAGIGNIYCNEALFDASIYPLQKAKDVDMDCLIQFLSSNKKRMEQAIEEGKVLARNRHFQIEDGWMDLHDQVYQKQGKRCPQCGMTIKRVELDGRGTYYCSYCQKKDRLRPYVIGVTGPIHSGKSLTSAIIAESDTACIRLDADRLAHEFYMTPEGISKVLQICGQSVFSVDGNIDIPALRNLLKSQPKIRKTLQNAVFSYVKKAIRERINQAEPPQYFVLDVPLLVPAKMESMCDVIVLVEAPDQLRRARLQKEGKDVEALLAINQDYPLEKTRKIADVIIHNDGSIDDLKSKLYEAGLISTR